METDNGAPASLAGFLGRQLRKLRTERGWSQTELATKAHTTGAMISYVENAKRVLAPDLARDLDATFGIDFFEELCPLVLAYAYPSWFLPYVELEREAKAIRSFQSQVVPGLLQTEEYARGTLAPWRPDNLDDLVAARLTRQALFDRDEPPHTWFILDEQVLRRRIGGPTVMRDQLERLLSAGRHPRCVIQVIPEAVAAHPGLSSAFTMLSFDQGEEKKPPHDVLHVDGFSRGRTALDPAEVNEGARAYDLLRSYALSPEESSDRIGEYMEGLTKR
ncbi:helix-turn-helix domain-containing protein [Streptomyces buecherae]|uniref:Helix-turn-helix transcriptional regulator n=1 Tax=Streptomyces buecherae TaxID=2763006 RepID=A0A7H8ND84_9ACTN|nr:helix-turn-helix transcriptional regulator [Streptomyces buecherae]QKW52413.1 helix-turn-helix transcriptional regulator [Streptomyces buecherae]